MVTDVIKHVKRAKGGTYNVKLLAAECGKRCLIGTVTGECKNPNCSFAHDLRMPDDMAAHLCTVIKEGTKAAVAADKQ